MRYLVAALLMATALTSGARGDEVKTATWFADHPEARAKVNALCKDNPGQAKHEPNCDNAFQGNVIAATRAAQAQSRRNYECHNVPFDGAHYWKDPANAQLRDYFGEAMQDGRGPTRFASKCWMECGVGQLRQA